MATYYYWTGSGVTARANSTVYATGARMVLARGDTSANYLVARQWVWEATTGGTSNAAVPTWPATVTADTTTVTDGTVTWTARTPGYSSGSTQNWTFAAIYFDYIITSPTAAGDQILVHYTSQENYTTNPVFTLPSFNLWILSVDKDNSNTITAMGTGGWIGSNGTARQITFHGDGANEYYVYGITFRPNGAQFFAIGTGVTETTITLENCYFYTCGNGGVRVGGNDNSSNYVNFVNCTFRFNAITDDIQCRAAQIILEGCTVSTLGARSSTLFSQDSAVSGTVTALGCDFSYITGTLIGDFTFGSKIFYITQCKLGAGVTVLATQTKAHKGAASAFVTDSASGDTHTFMGYYDALGSCVSDTGIYYTSGVAGQSWKITTTVNCNFYYPFTSPFVDYYNTSNLVITPYFEILRDGSTTAFQNDEVWAEFWVKTTSGSTQTTWYADRMPLLGTPTNQAAGSGTASWTGEQASAWSGKIDTNVVVIPAEAGFMRGRIVVGEPSITVYMDPQIRI